MKSVHIDYIKPGRKDLYFTIILKDSDIEEVEKTLNKSEKYIKIHPITIYDKDGELCVESAVCEIYVRNLESQRNKRQPLSI